MTVTTISPTATLAATTGTAWHERGTCNGLDTEVFFLPEGIRGPRKRAREAAAKAICAECPVMTQCLNWALATGEPYGVWGGTTPEEREVLPAYRAAV
jgi:WhiB family redox-sensing transcriptional regulator